MFRLTIKGRPIGLVFEDEQEVIRLYLRMHPVIQGVGWTWCEK